jgi:FkbM family methyltransferase
VSQLNGVISEGDYVLNVSRPSSVVKMACLCAWLWRFNDLRIALRTFKGVMPGTVLPLPFCGYTLYVDVSRSKLIYLQGERFVEERHLVRSLVKPGGCIVDVGANIGYYLLMFQRALNGHGKVICFEPEPSNLRELRRNIIMNAFSNVELFESAAGEGNGTVGLSCGINGVVAGHEEGDTTVRLMSLDCAVREKVDLIKIDVEGYEGQVLVGAEGLIKEFRPTLFVEMHPHMLTPHFSTEDIIRFIEKYYDRIEFYEKRRPHNRLRKFQRNYLGREALTSVTDVPRLVADCSRALKSEPYWMVCRSDR